jgi:hypothetical protein
MSPRWTLCADGGFQRLSGHRWGDERRAAMLTRSGRFGTIYTSAAEVRDRSWPAHGAFYSTILLPVIVYNNLDRKGLTPSPPRRFVWRPIWPSRPRAGRRRRPRARPDPPDASPGPPKHKVELFSCNFHRILLVFRAERPWRPGLQSAVVGWSHTVNTITPWASPEATLAETSFHIVHRPWRLSAVSREASRSLLEALCGRP